MRKPTAWIATGRLAPGWLAVCGSVLWVLVGLGRPLLAVQDDPANTKPLPITLIENVRVVLVEESFVTPPQNVMIQGEQIRAIGTPLEMGIDGEHQTVDGTGLFLIPGLFDSHVHLVSDPDNFAPLLVAHGVTSVRDLGGPTELVVGLKREAASRRSPCPDITVTGAIIDGNPPVWPFSEVCETPDQARQAVRKLAAAGVDQIKVYSLLKADVWRAAVEEARQVGLPATGHVPFSVPIEDAVSAGQRCIEHLEGFASLFNRMAPDPQAPELPQMAAAFRGWSRWDKVDRVALREHLAQHARAGTFHCPTLIVMRSIGRISDPADDPREDPRMEWTSSTMVGFWQTGKYDGFSPLARQALPAMSELVGEMHRAGVPMVVGSDLANPYVFPGSSVHEEMELLVAAGIPPAEVLKMATINAARLCGVEKERGLIEVGQTASLVLLRENPLENISAVRAIEGVFLRGKHFSRSALNRQLNNVRLRVARTAAPAADLKPEIPGTPRLQGQYRLSFQNMDAGAEKFLVTEEGQTSWSWSHLQPRGGGQQPALVITHFDQDGKFLEGKYRLLAGEKIEASYRIENGKLIGEATRNGKPLETVEVPLPEQYIFSTPAYAGEFNSWRQLSLQPGQSMETQSVGFGFPDWKPAATTVRIERMEDSVSDEGGARETLRHYRTHLSSEMGQMTIETSTSGTGEVLQSTLKFPFGTVSAQRVLETAPAPPAGEDK